VPQNVFCSLWLLNYLSVLTGHSINFEYLAFNCESVTKKVRNWHFSQKVHFQNSKSYQIILIFNLVYFKPKLTFVIIILKKISTQTGFFTKNKS
jgi:hypothetical protein